MRAGKIVLSCRGMVDVQNLIQKLSNYSVLRTGLTVNKKLLGFDRTTEKKIHR